MDEELEREIDRRIRLHCKRHNPTDWNGVAKSVMWGLAAIVFIWCSLR